MGGNKTLGEILPSPLSPLLILMDIKKKENRKSGSWFAMKKYEKWNDVLRYFPDIVLLKDVSLFKLRCFVNLDFFEILEEWLLLWFFTTGF